MPCLHFLSCILPNVKYVKTESVKKFKYFCSLLFRIKHDYSVPVEQSCLVWCVINKFSPLLCDVSVKRVAHVLLGALPKGPAVAVTKPPPS